MTRKPKNQKQLAKTATGASKQTRSAVQSFGEHLRELRRRVMYVALSICIFGGAAYSVEHHIVALLLRPAHGQQFIYTSPGGGIDFLFKVCLYLGIAASIPVIVYQILKFIEPLIKDASAHFIAVGSLISGLLAVGGMVFGYYIGLPNALHFLLHQFVTAQIKPLLTIQSYMSFVTVYMLGSALLFQAPLIMIFINRIKPLKPRQLLKGERWVILGAFVGAGLMNPTPNIFAQLLIAGPLVLTYQAGIIAIWLINRSRISSTALADMVRRDDELRAERLQKAATAYQAGRQKNIQSMQRLAVMSANANQPVITAIPMSAVVQPAAVIKVADVAPARPISSAPAHARPSARYFSDMVRPSRPQGSLRRVAETI